MKSHLFSRIYRHPKYNGYGKESAYRRFSILKDLKFESILDVGSGPCFLQSWLIENKIKSHYEAVDIREDCFQFCNCPTHTTIPLNLKFNLVCLFGTVTYNIDNDESKNKELLKKLLSQSKQVARSFLLFTVFKESLREKHKNKNPKNFFVYFHEDEIKNMLNSIGIFNYQIIENDKLDELEYFVLCHIDK
jgi:hypothetical protein